MQSKQSVLVGTTELSLLSGTLELIVLVVW